MLPLSRLCPSLFRSNNLVRLSLKTTAGMATEADWRRVTPTQAGIPSFSVFTKPIQKSPQDDREYRMIRLDNGLEAVLIHDGKADKAAASLDVAVGHLSDPVSGFRLFQ